MYICSVLYIVAVLMCLAYAVLESILCVDLLLPQVIEEDKPWLLKARRDVETQAKKMLAQGLELSVSVCVCVCV